MSAIKVYSGADENSTYVNSNKFEVYKNDDIVIMDSTDESRTIKTIIIDTYCAINNLTDRAKAVYSYIINNWNNISDSTGLIRIGNKEIASIAKSKNVHTSTIIRGVDDLINKSILIPTIERASYRIATNCNVLNVIDANSDNNDYRGADDARKKIIIFQF